MVSTISQPDAQSNQPTLVVDMTLEEFLQLPETKPASEFIKGKIHQKLMPQIEHSTIQGRLTALINQSGINQKSVHAFPELRCTFAGESIVPDIVVLEWAKIPRQANGKLQGKIEHAPDWIIEILSPDQRPRRVIDKIYFCIEHGTKIGWLIDPEGERVMIFQGDNLPDVKTNQDQLPVLDSLDGWQFSAADLFSWLYVEY